MRMARKSSLKLICKTEGCINKSIVYRRVGSEPETFYCKKCEQPLVKYTGPLIVKQDQKAKSDLKEFGLL